MEPACTWSLLSAEKAASCSLASFFKEGAYSCREISHTNNLSAVDLITNIFQDIKGPILDIILLYPEKLLFILDGFSELQYHGGDQEEDLTDNPQERKPVEILLCSLVKKNFPESCLLITARLTAMKKLHSLLKQPIQAEVLLDAQFPSVSATLALPSTVTLPTGLTRVDTGLPQPSPREKGVLLAPRAPGKGSHAAKSLGFYSRTVPTPRDCGGAEEGERKVPPPPGLLREPTTWLKAIEGGKKRDWLEKTQNEENEALRSQSKRSRPTMMFLVISFSSYTLIFLPPHSSCGRDLASVFETNQCLTDLEFVKNTLEDSGMKLLCEGLKQPNCTLQTLRLCASLLPESSEAVCKYLASVLICNPHLTELDLNENPLGDKGVKYLCEGLRHSNCKLEKLDLSKCYLSDVSCVELSSFLQPSWCLHLSRLSECSLSVASCKPLVQVQSSTWSLTRLLLINNRIEDLGLKLLCEGLKQPGCQLKDLVLWTCHLTETCCQDFCSTLYTNEHLRDLDLSDNALGEEGMKVLCEGLKHPCCKLQSLWLAECHLTGVCYGALASKSSNRNENLTLLDLSGNDLKDFGVQMLCDVLIHPICKLQIF
uniref:NACHT, LRR and PYD domains-containing protein 12-like n=1 Tax=Ictidomys tridecemlineatus TaxID=43179 RepID=UPI001A9D5296|nr:NACHT, LRR and PYD domains-containing protein 12-like [Ictidomys tridecemlineatus]